MIRLLLLFVALTSLISCKSTCHNSKTEFQLLNDSINLYAFIGEKISVTEFDPNENNTKIVRIDSITGDTLRRVRYVMDAGFKCKYKIIRNIFNDLKTDTIEFEAYDHYGRPAFEDYENVILYISLSEIRGVYYHQKYLFDPVKMAKMEMWEGLEGENLKRLFRAQRKVLTERGVFD